jgi:hypothetical protein
LRKRRAGLLFNLQNRPNSTISVSPDNRDLFMDVMSSEGTNIWVADVLHW